MVAKILQMFVLSVKFIYCILKNYVVLFFTLMGSV